MNTLTVGALVTSISEDVFYKDIDTDTDAEVSFSVTNSGTIEPQYKIKSVKGLSCNDGFYNDLYVDASHAGDTFSAALNGFVSTSTFDGLWDFRFKATSTLSASHGETCEINLVIQSWQKEFPQYNTGGFYEEKIITVVLTAGESGGSPVSPNVVLNEIYPNEDKQAAAPLEREWIELYNTGEEPVDVEGWSIGEFAGNSTIETLHVISSTNVCSEGEKVGFARPYGGVSTIIPAKGLLIIEFCAKNRIHNNGDTVRLFDSTSVLEDAYEYPATVKGKSHARIPDGGVWVDPIPTPGTPNVASENDLLAEGWSIEQISEFFLNTTVEYSQSTDEALTTDEMTDASTTNTLGGENTEMETTVAIDNTGDGNISTDADGVDTRDGENEDINAINVSGDPFVDISPSGDGEILLEDVQVSHEDVVDAHEEEHEVTPEPVLEGEVKTEAIVNGVQEQPQETI
jgi:hypothetical protein